MAILCVGGAYFVIGVLLPLALYLTGQYEWPALTGTGLTFSSLAGVAGAVGAICVIFATQAAMKSASDAGLPPATYRVFIAPLIFGLAPVINVLISVVWHPQKGVPLHFAFKMPHPLLWVGIVLVGVGAGLVLYSKELSESSPSAAVRPAPVAAAAPETPAAAPEAKQ
jgi:hypothetical protein